MAIGNGSQLWRYLAGIACLFLLIGFTVGCPDGESGSDGGAGGSGSDGQKKRIVFLTNGDDPFWDACRAGMDKAAEDLDIESAGLTHNMDKGSEFDAVKQLSKLEQYATQSDIAGVAIEQLDNKKAHEVETPT